MAPRAGWLRSLRSDTRGANLVEYILILGMVALVVIAGYKIFGTTAKNAVDKQGQCVEQLRGCTGAVNPVGLVNGGTSDPKSSNGGAVSPVGQGTPVAQAGPPPQAGSPPPQAGTPPAPPPPAPPPPPPPPPSRGIGTRALDVGKGIVVDGLWGTVKGLYHVVRHPVDTVEGLGTAIAHPINTGTAIKDAVVKSWNENPERTIGAGIFEVATIVVAPAKIGKVGKAAEIAEKAGEATKLAEKAAELAKIEKAAEAAKALERAEEAAKAAKAAEEAAAAAKALDKAEAAAATARKVKQATADLEKLFKDAEVAQKELAQNTAKIASETGGKPVIPDKLKSLERAEAKIKTDYGGDASQILDLSRASIEYQSVEDLQKGLAKIKEVYGDKVVRIKDRFADVGPTGYRDVLINVEASNGHVSELQVHLQQILEVKNGPGHALYEQAQAIERAAKEANRALTADEAAKLQEIVAKQKELYDAAYEAAQRAPKVPPK